MKEQMQGITKILVTHDMNSIANMADRVFLMDRGRVIQEGKPLEVIENYLKMMHTEVFAESRLEEVSEESIMIDTNWIPVTSDDIGGAGEVKILAAYYKINGVKTDVVKAGDEIQIGIQVRSEKDISELIVGYIFKDKYGNSIMGENSIGSGLKLLALKKERLYHIRFKVKWKEVKEGDYFLTIGLGEGTDQMIHKIQCWAHNIFHLEGIALKPMHGIINNNIISLEIECIKN